MIKNFFYVMAIFALLCSCSPKVIVQEKTKVEYRDSVVTKIDSVEVPVPVEVIKEVAFDYAPLHLETSLAEADVVADTTNRMLVGKIQNKAAKFKAPVEHKLEYHARDSLIYAEIPVEVIRERKVTPTWCWWVLVISIIMALGYVAIVYFTWRK